ncbi:MAG: PAS domain S-box protein [Methanomicrobiales archaeon]|nr:PAS domain S-box protein [Methanomicrobiales archaeon]
MYSLLYVDDEPDLLELGTVFLEETGDFQVTTATSVDEGLAVLARGHIDAVISDYQMDGRDGLSFLLDVRKTYGDLPFILFTGRGREEVVIEAINNGVDFYIQKGGDVTVQFAELSHKILQAIRRKEAENDLFHSRQMLELVLDTIPQRVFWKDTRCVFLGCNKPLARDTGYSHPRDLVGKDDFQTASCELAGHYQADDRRVMETGIPKLSFEEPQIKPDGQQAWLRTSKVPLRNKDGEIIGVLGTYEDITDQKRTHDELARAKEYFAAIFDSVNDAIFVHDATTGRIVNVNQTCTRMYGYLREEFLSMDVGDFSAGIPPYTQEDAIGWISRCTNGGPQLFRWLSRRKDGTLFMTEVNMRSARIGSQELVIVTERDISSRPKIVP